MKRTNFVFKSNYPNQCSLDSRVSCFVAWHFVAYTFYKKENNIKKIIFAHIILHGNRKVQIEDFLENIIIYLSKLHINLNNIKVNVNPQVSRNPYRFVVGKTHAFSNEYVLIIF